MVRWCVTILQPKGSSTISGCYNFGDKSHFKCDWPWMTYKCMKDECNVVVAPKISRQTHSLGSKYLICNVCGHFKLRVAIFEMTHNETKLERNRNPVSCSSPWYLTWLRGISCSCQDIDTKMTWNWHKLNTTLPQFGHRLNKKLFTNFTL